MTLPPNELRLAPFFSLRIRILIPEYLNKDPYLSNSQPSIVNTFRFLIQFIRQISLIYTTHARVNNQLLEMSTGSFQQGKTHNKFL